MTKNKSSGLTSAIEPVEAIRIVLKENENNILETPDKFITELERTGCPYSLCLSLGLILTCGNIQNILFHNNHDVSMKDINNMIICIKARTGLCKTKVIELLTILLQALDLTVPISEILPEKEDTSHTKKILLLDYHNFENDLIQLNLAIKNDKIEELLPLLPRLNLLAKAGVPDAMYLKGLCYLRGIGTVKDEKHAIKYLIAAANDGCGEAGALLGDIYYNADDRNYNLAYDYYTSLGAVSLSDERQNNIKAILTSDSMNIKTMFFNAIFIIYIFSFNVMLFNGTFSAAGALHHFWPVFSDILVCLIYAASIFYYRKYRFNNLTWSSLAIFIASLFCTVFAL
jgi:hypothetical protein